MLLLKRKQQKGVDLYKVLYMVTIYKYVKNIYIYIAYSQLKAHFYGVRDVRTVVMLIIFMNGLKSTLIVPPAVVTSAEIIRTTILIKPQVIK